MQQTAENPDQVLEWLFLKLILNSVLQNACSRMNQFICVSEIANFQNIVSLKC